MPAHDLVVSLGPNCRSAWNVRQAFGVQRAYPFDWWITPAKSLLRMLEPGFVFTLSRDDLLAVPPKPGGETSIYNRRLHILHHHDFPRRDGVVPMPDAAQVAEVQEKYRARFARLHADLAAARAPLAVLNGIFPGWAQDPTGTGAWNEALNGRVPPRALIAGLRDRLGPKLRVAIIGAGPARVREFEGGVAISLPPDPAAPPTPGAPAYAEPVQVFRACFQALGLTS